VILRVKSVNRVWWSYPDSTSDPCRPAISQDAEEPCDEAPEGCNERSSP
jgi:hypothetical protein